MLLLCGLALAAPLVPETRPDLVALLKEQGVAGLRDAVSQLDDTQRRAFAKCAELPLSEIEACTLRAFDDEPSVHDEELPRAEAVAQRRPGDEALIDPHKKRKEHKKVVALAKANTLAREAEKKAKGHAAATRTLQPRKPWG